MQGGVILFRGTGADALRYVESDRSRADDYYLSDDAGIQYAMLNASGTAVSVGVLTGDEYNGWVDWINPDTGESMGKARLAGPDRLGSPRFAEMTINNPKSLSIAAALHLEVSEALDLAQQEALSEIQRWLVQHSSLVSARAVARRSFPSSTYRSLASRTVLLVRVIRTGIFICSSVRGCGRQVHGAHSILVQSLNNKARSAPLAPQ